MDDTIARPRLLLVEDDQDNLEALSILLAERCDVFGYESPTDAVRAVEAVRPDLLLLDIRTAPIDGVRCLELIRALPGYHDVPAVAFTGFGLAAERQGFLAAGFQAVVGKPVFDPRRQLIAVIERVLASPGAADRRAATYPLRRALPAVVRLDCRTTIAASFARGFGQADRRAPARPRDEDPR